MMSYATIARYFVITTTLATIAGTLPIRLMLKRNYNYYNPEENIGSKIYLAEGDILVDRRRSFDSPDYKTWYDRTVPYEFGSQFGPEEIKQVEAAMINIQNSSCVKFKRRTTESDYLQILIPESGCYSAVGRKGGQQVVGLSKKCFASGTIQHELFHAMGLGHEHTRMDRDDYIKVQWNNIDYDHKNNFNKDAAAQSREVLLRLPYDYGSVMHYGNNTFASDPNKPTLVPRRPLPKGVVMGQRDGFSHGDIDKLNALYKCNIRNCTDPGALPYGYTNGINFNVGSRIRFSCLPDYILVGAPERECLDVGQWSGYHPACLASNQGKAIYYCNFDNKEKSLCDWTRGPNDNISWIRNTGPTKSAGTGPYSDHTLISAVGTGGYAYVEASNGHPGYKARLISPELVMSSRYRTCLAFFTYMYGDNMGNLTVYVKEEVNSTSFINTDLRPIFSLQGEQGQYWKQIFLVLGQMQNAFYVIIEGSVGPGFKSDIAIDDVIVGDCSSLKPIAISGGLAENIECTFDSGNICSFLQDNHDSLEWEMASGRTRTLLTGPNCDPVNCDTGNYLYIETSRPAKAGDLATLTTPVLGGSGHCCLFFYYNMYGRDIGSLTIKLTNVNSGNTRILWALSGNQGEPWQVKRVDFNAPEAYTVAFEGTVGPSYRGDIAIDSISITTGRCSAVRRFDCNFEQDTCDWQNAISPTVSKQWVRHRGHTDTPNTGPSRDRSNANGYYIYVEASRSYEGESARLVSPAVPYLQRAQCLTFWYHMYGSSIGNLTVYTQTDTGYEIPLWTLSGDQGNQWVSERLNLTTFENGSREFYVIFEATLAGSEGDMALDDISLYNTPCTS